VRPPLRKCAAPSRRPLTPHGTKGS
jgi:hypothetical protein